MKVLITGGAGSLGSTIVKKLVKHGDEVRVLSRNEKNQNFLERELGVGKVKFYIGDIRNRQRVREVVRGCDTVIHTAALKFLPVCESNVWETVTTNVYGTRMVLEESVAAGVKNMVNIGTDKDVQASSVYGYTKYLGEKITLEMSRLNPGIKFVNVRLVNLLKSRGSVYQVFIKQIHENKPLTLTAANAIRFFMTLNQAADCVLNYPEYESGTTIVPLCKYATMGDFVDAIKEIYNYKKDTEIIGMGDCEKMTESLIFNEYVTKKDNHFVITPTPTSSTHSKETIDVDKLQKMDKSEMKRLLEE